MQKNTPMKDIFKNYHKHKVLLQSSIIGMSLLLAISINTFVLSWTTGESLKASVIDATSTAQATDLLANFSDGTLEIIAQKDMQNVTEFSLWMTYDNSLLDFWEVRSDFETSSIENESWYIRFLSVTQAPLNINSGESILSISVSRNKNISARANFIEGNFKDTSADTYSLSIEWISF